MTVPPKAVVADASVLVDVLRRWPGAQRYERLLVNGARLHAPATVDLEVTSATRRLELGGHLDARRGEQLLEDFAEFVVERHPLAPLTPRVWSIREWARVTDGYYVALAEALGVPLLTTDRRLARALTDRELVDVVDIDAS